MQKNEMNDIKDKIKNSLHKLEKWVEDHDYKAYEPFDGLSSYLRPLTFGNLFLDRVLLQIIRQSPINLRPMLGITPQESTKGRGYMACGYLSMYRTAGQEQYKEKAVRCLDWLIENKSPKFEKYSWANHFDFASRTGRYSKHESIIVWTALIGQAFLDAYEILENDKYLKTAISVSDWILDLPRERTDTGACISYYALGQSSIHNSNMLGAAMLARTSKFTGYTESLKVAKEAMEYSLSRQLPNGAWYYGEAPNQHWIDNFHTGYNLDSLKCYIESTGDKKYEANLRLGFEYFKNTFFENTGRPKYYHDRTYPVDSQCAAQAIETLANFSEYDSSSLTLGLNVAKWTIDNMQDETGYFYYRQYPLGIKAKTPMLHWAQATTYKALSLLMSKLVR
jgi:rhamnogalacturonyl hydrolase YesR